MLEFNDNNEKITYSEEHQANKIRFQIYKKVSKGTYESVTGKFKCKDFFNDVVTAYKSGIDIDVYRFNASANLLNTKDEEGVPVMLYNLLKGFDKHWEKANTWLKSQNLPSIKVERFPDCDDAIAWIPWEYFDNTYYISAVTLLLRVCNYGDLKDFDKAATQLDNQDKNRITALFKHGMDLGDKQEYIWYYASNKKGFKKGSTTDYQFSSLTHNCGLMAWHGGY